MCGLVINITVINIFWFDVYINYNLTFEWCYVNLNFRVSSTDTIFIRFTKNKYQEWKGWIIWKLKVKKVY